MGSKKVVLVGFLFLGLAPGAFAQDTGASLSSGSSAGAGTSTAHLPGVLKDKKFEENTEITDPRLRAEAGSRSRYSVKATLNFSGPRVDNVSSPDQPNPDRLVGRHKTALTGSIGTRYRIDRDRAISFGTGLSAVTPFQGLRRFDVNNPYLSYDITEKVNGFQIHLAPSISAVTVPENRAVGEDAKLGFSTGAVYDIGASRWSANLATRIEYTLFDRPYVRKDHRASQAGLAFYPGLKYQLNDKVNISGSIAIGYMNPRALGDQTALHPKTVTGRLGLGWAPKRDVYLYPFLTVYPTALSLDTTSVNFSTIFSVL